MSELDSHEVGPEGLPATIAVGAALQESGLSELLATPLPAGAVWNIGFQCGLTLATLSPATAAMLLRCVIDEQLVAAKAAGWEGKNNGYGHFAAILVKTLHERGIDATVN